PVAEGVEQSRARSPAFVSQPQRLRHPGESEPEQRGEPAPPAQLRALLEPLPTGVFDLRRSLIHLGLPSLLAHAGSQTPARLGVNLACQSRGTSSKSALTPC